MPARPGRSSARCFVAEPLGCVAERRRRAVAGGRQRDRRDPAPDERRLLVEAEREAEVGQLAERARPAGAGAGLLLRSGPPRSRRAPRPASAAGRRRSRGAAVPSRAIESRLTTATTAAGSAECSTKRCAPSPPNDAAVRGEEEELLVRPRRLRRRARRAAVRAGELDQRGRARGVVVRAGTQPVSSRWAMTTIASACAAADDERRRSGAAFGPFRGSSPGTRRERLDPTAAVFGSTPKSAIFCWIQPARPRPSRPTRASGPG